MWRKFPRTQPRRPAKSGLRARSKRGQIGESWWSGRFIAALEKLTDPERLQRGRSYARSGQVLQLEVAPGMVTAEVQGSSRSAYEVDIALTPLSGAQWSEVEEAMADQAIFLAALLTGEMPRGIEEAFVATGLSLFPTTAGDLTSDCSCPDPTNPCKHIAAVIYLLAEKFDEDPFQIFAWRGRTKEELIERLRAQRMKAVRAAAREKAAAEASAGAPERDSAAGLMTAGLEGGGFRESGLGESGLGESGAAGSELPYLRLLEEGLSEVGLSESESTPPLSDALHDFWRAGAEIAQVSTTPHAAEVSDALLRQLGPLALEVRGTEATTVLAQAYRLLTTAAERRALGGRKGGSGG